MGKPQLHQSHLSMLTRCGEQYRRRYILGERRPPGVAAHVGSSIHRAHDVDMLSKIQGSVLAPIEETEAALQETLNARWDEDGVHLTVDQADRPEKVIRGEALDRAIRINKVRHADLAPLLTPKSISRKWVVELEGYPYDLAGEMDLEADDGLHDLKTTGGWPASGSVHSSEQLTIYTIPRHFCDGIPLPQEVHLDYCIDVQNKKSVTTKVIQQHGIRTQDHIDAMLAKLERVMEVLEKGVFLPANASEWWCSPRFCGYWTTCPFVKGR